MSRGCDTHIGNEINQNGRGSRVYDVLREELDNFPSHPVACNNFKTIYCLLYYTFNCM